MPLRVTASSATDALRIAQGRGVLPMSLSTAEARRQISADIRRNSVFSARTTNAIYVHALRTRVDRLLQGGADNDMAQLRLELKLELQRLGYTPEKGFPGNDKLGIPPAEPGSLRDLSSDRRINLILNTQRQLMAGSAMKARGEDGTRMKQFPAWELVRILPRNVERGSPDSKAKGWRDRFIQAGGVITVDGEGRDRYIALKGSPVWAALGDSGRFSDALDTSHPPFAFESGMGWDEVHWRELDEVGFEKAESTERGAGSGEREEKTIAVPEAVPAGEAGLSADKSVRAPVAAPVPEAVPAGEAGLSADKSVRAPVAAPGARVIPAPKISAKDLDETTIAALKRSIADLQVVRGVLTIGRILAAKTKEAIDWLLGRKKGGAP